MDFGQVISLVKSLLKDRGNGFNSYIYTNLSSVVFTIMSDGSHSLNLNL
jgi:hypothetical protein